jgi:vacuolar-type H+-ATPase subunit I/STV1
MEGDEEKETGAPLRTASASSATTLSAKDSCSIVAHDEILSYEIGRSTFSTQDADRMRSQIARSTFSTQGADQMRSQLDQIQRQLKELSSHLEDLSSTKNSASIARNSGDTTSYQP